MAARVGWAEFDATGPSVNVGWCEFDTLANPFKVCVGWAELDCLSPTADPTPPYRPGGGTRRYHSHRKQNYEIPVIANEDEEEEIILKILMEIARDEL